ncbi:P2X purinoceptor 7 [Holothuria leucospilota]|uniref:P2X purinoceptor 7 n=1 Tax=Holothuria leucospilota TaxID=206669 RepID=A0A9Q1BT96_HOLLE|nr:P2X purinoceptor 7 [Holothuria leucospilota]
MIAGALDSMGLRIRQALRGGMHRIDQERIERRRRHGLHRREYRVAGPNALWHIDGNHKLIRWRFVIHGEIDGFSRLPVFLDCHTDNKASSMMASFRMSLECLRKFGQIMEVTMLRFVSSCCMQEVPLSLVGVFITRELSGFGEMFFRHPEDLQGMVVLEDPHGDEPENDVEWCRCGHCRDMPTDIESVCCRRRVGACVTSNAHFGSLIIDPGALGLAMAQRMDLQLGDRPGNNAYRHAAYKSYIYWKCGPTRRHNKVIIPACAVWKIRDGYPSEDGRYTGFRINRL